MATGSQQLPTNLVEIQSRIERCAGDYGLDFFPTVFEMVDSRRLNDVAAYGGFPTRFPHWRFGMEYERLSKSHSYGLQKIHELVINNNPCYAYLLDTNSVTDHKLVMAHVYGHCDFFKNNDWFRHTNRKMIDEMANHGNRIRRYMDRFGVEEVESFIDACFSIEDLIDIHSPFIKRRDDPGGSRFAGVLDEEEEPLHPARLPAKNYMDAYINPAGELARELEARRRRRFEREAFPPEPLRDVMLFVLEHAPLKPWQADVLAMIRQEAYYFAPQAQTKIMNEGWATYWHSTIMTRHGIEPGELIGYADHCAGTLAGSPTRLNPYKLGVELLRDIEDRWNRGCFGEEYERCDDWAAHRDWDTGAGLGREKIFEVRRIHNDVTLIDEFLTLDFCRRRQLFSFAYNESSGYYHIESRRFENIKRQLLFQLTNLGRPIIAVRDGNYKNRGELFLEHHDVGAELKVSFARDALANLHRLWTRPVHIETVLGGLTTLLSFDGAEHSTTTSKPVRRRGVHEAARKD